MNNWEWPQYLLAVWWFGLFFAMLGVTIQTKGVRGWRKAWTRWVGVATLIFVLYMGGFWT